MHSKVRADTEAWARNIKAARDTAGLTQKDAGERCGVDQTTFSRWERGKLVPTEDNKLVIARVFGQEPRDMFPIIEQAAEPAAAAS
jgi:transcriptional regulator with XRE-family HTH domain